VAMWWALDFNLVLVWVPALCHDEGIRLPANRFSPDFPGMWPGLGDVDRFSSSAYRIPIVWKPPEVSRYYHGYTPIDMFSAGCPPRRMNCIAAPAIW